MTQLLMICYMVIGATITHAEKGSGSTGGGDVLICKSGFLSKKRVYLADSYNFLANNIGKLSSKLSNESKFEVIRKQLNYNMVGLGDVILEELSKLEFVYVDKVEELDGDNINLPAKCKKKQLAIQDIETGIVKTNRNLYKKLSSWEHVLFKVHEAFIRLRNPGPNTTLVRDEVQNIITSRSFEELIGNELPVAEIDNYQCSQKMIKIYRSVLEFHQQNLSQGPLLAKEEILKDLEGMTFNTLGDLAQAMQRSSSLARIYEGIDANSFEGISPRSIFVMALKTTFENNYKQATKGYTKKWAFSSPIQGQLAQYMMTLNICDAVPEKKK